MGAVIGGAVIISAISLIALGKKECHINKSNICVYLIFGLYSISRKLLTALSVKEFDLRFILIQAKFPSHIDGTVIFHCGA